MNAATVFEPKTNSLVGIAGVNDNPQFAFRIVAEFESTAVGTANAMYIAAAAGGISHAVQGDVEMGGIGDTG